MCQVSRSICLRSAVLPATLDPEYTGSQPSTSDWHRTSGKTLRSDPRRCCNTSNARLKQLLSGALPPVLEMLGGGEPLVEVGEAW